MKQHDEKTSEQALLDELAKAPPKQQAEDEAEDYADISQLVSRYEEEDAGKSHTVLMEELSKLIQAQDGVPEVKEAVADKDKTVPPLSEDEQAALSAMLFGAGASKDAPAADSTPAEAEHGAEEPDKDTDVYAPAAFSEITPPEPEHGAEEPEKHTDLHAPDAFTEITPSGTTPPEQKTPEADVVEKTAHESAALAEIPAEKPEPAEDSAAPAEPAELSQVQKAGSDEPEPEDPEVAHLRAVMDAAEQNAKTPELPPEAQTTAEAEPEKAPEPEPETVFAPESPIAEGTDSAPKAPKKTSRFNLTKLQMILIVLGIVIAGVMIALFSMLLRSAHSSKDAVKLDAQLVPEADMSWQTHVISAQSPAAEDFSVATTVLNNSNGISVDSRILDDTYAMLDALRAADPDEDIAVSAGYTSVKDYQELFNARVQEYVDEGYSETEAQAQAAQSVAPPGTDEHSSGLLINIAVDDNSDPTYVAQTPAYQWLIAHAWEYGFIPRYPQGKEAVTGHGADATAWRYVGKDAAKIIHEQGLALEEYNAQHPAETEAQAQ